MLSVWLGTSRIELPYRSLLGTLSLLSLAIAKLHRKLGQTSFQVYCLILLEAQPQYFRIRFLTFSDVCRRLFTVHYFSLRSSGSSTHQYGQPSWFQLYRVYFGGRRTVSEETPLALTSNNPGARPLGRFETKMIGKRSIPTILGRIGEWRV